MTQRAWPVVLLVVLHVGACNGSFRFDDVADAGASDGSSDAPHGRSCTKDAECNFLQLRCDATSGRCVGCVADSDCSTPGARCEPTEHVCVECLSARDCGEKKSCDEGSGRCLDACTDDDDPCPIAGFACDGSKHTCVECKTSAACAGSARGSRCDTTLGICVECTSNAHCPEERPRCDRHRGKCSGCVTSSDCPLGAACDPSAKTCVALP